MFNNKCGICGTKYEFYILLDNIYTCGSCIYKEPKNHLGIVLSSYIDFLDNFKPEAWEEVLNLYDQDSIYIIGQDLYLSSVEYKNKKISSAQFLSEISKFLDNIKENYYDEEDIVIIFSNKTTFTISQLFLFTKQLLSKSISDSLIDTELLKKLSLKSKRKNKEISLEFKYNHKEIADRLKENIIGQDKAINELSLSIYRHFKAIELGLGEFYGKPNVLMIGPTGSGKTLIIKELSKILGEDYIVYKYDATRLTEVGYIGDDVDDILIGALKQSNYNIKKIENKSIIFIDEFDKLGNRSGFQKDINGSGVQKSLLKFIEGGNINLSEKKRNMMLEITETFNINLDNILFIFAGVFNDRNEKIRVKESFIGGSQSPDISNKKEKKITLSKKIDYNISASEKIIENAGFSREIIGRLSVTVLLNKLEERHYKEILESENYGVLKRHKEILGVNSISFSDASIKKIIKKIDKLNLGARGIDRILNIIFNPIYNEPNKFINSNNSIIIDENLLKIITQ